MAIAKKKKSVTKVIPQNPDRDPDISGVRAIITSRWGKSYTPKIVREVERFYVDTALDNDADTWTLDIGDPNGEYLSLIDRDAEIRVQLFGVGQTGLHPLVTGIADEAEYTDGSWTLTGRDYSSLATDSVVMPQNFKHVRAWEIVDKQAKQLKFPRTNLSEASYKKTQYTDGSETYWDFWYRLYRKDKMWIWCEPDGTLVAGPLSYGQQPLYYFGDPRDDDGVGIRRWMNPIISFSMRKTTQSRIYEVYVYGHKGDTGFVTPPQRDPALAAWTKKPRKLMMDTETHTIQGAKTLAWNEIFEGKVGSVEYTATIADPGFPIRQNNIVRVYLEDIGLFGNFFVVGNRIQAGPDGFLQQVRLREQQYAVSRRIPADPKKKTREPGDKTVASSLGASVEEQVGSMPTGWGDYFVKAAKKWHGTADYRLFLATLIAIADKETGGAFLNERQNGGPGGHDHINWYPYRPPTGLGMQAKVPGQPAVKAHGETRAEYEIKFVNESGGKYNCPADVGVGPMQLTSQGLKEKADDLLKPNHRDQYEGGRWHPEWNIMVGAEYLQSCWKDTGAARDIDMWLAADAYNRGSAGAKSYFATNGTISPYGQDIKAKVLVDPKYVTKIDDAVTASQQAAKDAEVDGPFTAPESSKLSPNGRFVMPLSTPTNLNQSEFDMVDAEGAPDAIGVRHHAGKDWFAPGGTSVVAPADGKIVIVEPSTGSSGQVFGGQVKLQMQSGHVWVFRHVIPASNMKVGLRVKAGYRLASVVRWSDNPASSHCHMEFWMTLAGGYYFPNMRDPCKILSDKG